MDDFRESFEGYLRQTFFADRHPSYYESADYQNSMAEILYARAERFEQHLVPWIQDVFSLSGAKVVEIGSGTGASAQALYRHCGSILCYEIEPKSLAAAKVRAEMLGMNNVRFADGPFLQSCELEHQDVVIMVGVIEHMPLTVVKEVLTTAFRILRPGGVIVITDTPNRLSAFDYHTSWLPFFQWLPDDLKLEYLDRSPRDHFIQDVRACSPNEAQRMRDWGVGVSYHEFEIALGTGVHEMIIADGWEEKMLPLANIFNDDHWLRDMFDKMELKAHRAFARSWLNLIIQKP